MPTVLESVRQEWAEGYRRLEAASGDGPRYERLLAELELVLDQLRRRVGQTFTLDELARAYTDADRWAQEALLEQVAAPGWPGRLSTVQDAAFHLYSRGALDYSP
jgi:alcohol dehydrogenase class IV